MWEVTTQNQACLNTVAASGTAHDEVKTRLWTREAVLTNMSTGSGFVSDQRNLSAQALVSPLALALIFVIYWWFYVLVHFVMLYYLDLFIYGNKKQINHVIVSFVFQTNNRFMGSRIIQWYPDHQACDGWPAGAAVLVVIYWIVASSCQ